MHENTDPVQGLVSARIILRDIRIDLYRYTCTPDARDAVRSGIYQNFFLLRSKTASAMPTGQDIEENDSFRNFSRILAGYEEQVHDALDDVDQGKEHEILSSLHDGPLSQTHQSIDDYLSAASGSSHTGEISDETDTLQTPVAALFTVIEIIGAIAVLFPGVFVSVGVPATLIKPISMLNQVQKVYPGVQLVLDRKNEIMILAGTMAAFAGGMHKNATRLLEQMGADQNLQNITVVDETGRAIPASELVQYARELQNEQENPEDEGEAARENGQQSGAIPDPDMISKITGMMESIRKPIAETFTAADTYAHQGILARMNDVSRGREFVLQVPLTLCDAGVRVGTDITARMRELTEKVNLVAKKDPPEEEKP